MVHPRGLNHISFVISAVTTTQCSMKKLEKLSLKKNHANHNFVIYIFVNAQKVVHPRGFNHMSFVISAVTTTQCSMRKLEKLSLKKNLANHTGLLARVAKRLVSFFPLFHSFLHFTFFPLNFFLLLITINTANIISFSLSLSLSLPLTPSV